MSLLEIEDLSVFIRRRKLFSFSDSRHILRNVNLSVNEGSVIGLIGESGAGKTTLARCIAGLCDPTSGKILYGGIEIYPAIKNRDRIRKEIQLLFQNHTASLDPQMTIRQSLLEGVDARAAETGMQLRWLLSVAELPTDVLPRRPRELSGGQRQRIALARALSVSPRLLILDEPTSAADALTQEQILSTLKLIRKESKLTIIYISHDLRSTSAIADAIAVMKSGTIVEFAPKEELLSHPKHEYTKELLRTGRME